jgi:DNA-binding SARP family transcriptional activator
MESEIAFLVLGPLVVRAGASVLPVPPGKQRALLAALLMSANQMVSRDELTEALWGGDPPRSARATLHNYVKVLRKTLGATGESRITTVPDGYLMSVSSEELDVLRFETLQNRARDAAREGAWARAAQELRAALSLWRGEPLADVLSDLLVLREVPRLAEMRLQAIEGCIDAELHLGRHGEVIAELRRLTAMHPLREKLHALLMLALYRDGQQGEALAAFQQVRRVLVQELGAEPGAELRHLEQQILIADPALAAPSPAVVRTPAGLPARAEALGLVAVPASLPPDLADFSGRARQVEQLTQLLRVDGRSQRTVILTAVAGAGGVGKTALAIHSAHLLSRHFQAGQLYLNLRGSSGQPMAPADALARILRDLGTEPGAVPASETERAARYRTLTAGKRLLLVLDDARDAAQVRPLLPGPGGCVLVTSRRSLPDLEAAHLMELDVMSDADAAALFASIAGAHRAALEGESVREVLAACGGLPLAIRIAAARLNARPGWSVRVLAARLNDAHRRLDELRAGDLGVRASFMVSYDSVRLRHDDAGPRPDQTFRLLALAEGPDISLQAAAALLGVPPEQAERSLEELVDAHLLQSVGAGRYRFHDLLRLYAAERAHAEEDSRARLAAVTRLLSWYLNTAAAATGALNPQRRFPATFPPPAPGTTPLQFTTYHDGLDWLDAEYANLVAAAELAAGYGQHEVAWKLPISMSEYFCSRGQMDDWVVTHERALASVRSLRDRQAELGVHNNLGFAYSQAGRLEDAIECTRQLVETARRIGSPREIAMAKQNLGSALADAGRPDEAFVPLAEALLAHRESGFRVAEAFALVTLGSVGRQRKDYDQAVSYLLDSVKAFRELADRWREHEALLELSGVHLDLGEIDAAENEAKAVVAVSRELGNRSCEARALTALGRAERARGDLALARAHWAQAMAILTELGDTNGAATTMAELELSEPFEIVAQD